MPLPASCTAAVLYKFGEPLVLETLALPTTIEPGAIIVKMEVASVCGTDVHFWQGEFGRPDLIPLPIVLGHEMVGRVAALGAGVSKDSVGEPLDIGDRIIWTHGSCGQCYYCVVAHQEVLCPTRRINLQHTLRKFPYLVGGFSEYCYVFPQSGRIKVPDEVPSDIASAASCALRTVINGFDRLGRIAPDETVVIQGAGALGLFSTALAVHAGASQVIVFGAPDERLRVAERWGASRTVSIERLPDADARRDEVLRATGGRGADIVIEVSGGHTAFPEGLDLCRPGGRYLVIGQIGGHRVSIAPTTIVLKQITIIGAQSGGPDHYHKALQFIKATRHRFTFQDLLTNRYNLADINQALEAMRAFREVKAVIEFPNA